MAATQKTSPVVYIVVIALFAVGGWVAWQQAKPEEPKKHNGHVMIQVDEGEHLIEFRADWTPQRREIWGEYWIGEASFEFNEDFDPDNPGNFEQAEAVLEGTEVSMTVESPEWGTISCEIWQDEVQVVAEEITGMTPCIVHWVVVS